MPQRRVEHEPRVRARGARLLGIRLPGARVLGAVVGAAVAVAMLGGCAQVAPVADWTPPAWPDAAAHLVVSGDGNAESAGAGSDGSGSGSADAGSGSEGIGAPVETSGQDLGFIERRLRNDHSQFQARYVEIPGWHMLNVRIEDLVSAAIDSTGTTFRPEVFPVSAGLSHAGCVPGSASWPAARVLSDAETGPPNGTGTAVVCEVTAAFAGYVGVTMRTVAGGPDGVKRDELVTLYTDLESGEVYEAGDLWTSEAGGELWLRAVALLRQEAGGLSGAPSAAPDDAQLALARRALETVRFGEDGVRFTLPPGVVAPEFEGLGIGTTTEPVVVEVDAETVTAWLSERGAAMHARSAEAFEGLPEWSADQPVDCGLFACVAVTYDDGPSPYTDELLDTLRAQQSAATFFMVGSSVRSYPEEVQRVAAEGHEIGSHTMTHPDLTKLSVAKARKQVRDAAALITKQTGDPVTLFRPPYGAVNDKVLTAAGMPAILWSIDTLDWKEPGTEALVERSVGAASPGDIILFHDIHEPSVEAADVVVRGLRDRGFTLVTVSQLFDGKVPKGKVFGR